MTCTNGRCNRCGGPCDDGRCGDGPPTCIHQCWRQDEQVARQRRDVIAPPPAVPRRARIDLQTPVEGAIRAAIAAVEALPPDERLTDAVVLLSQALARVADYVDGVR